MRLFAKSYLAADSNDHLYPVGAINDNYNNPTLVDLIEKEFQPQIQKISFLDLGCAGGGFVKEFIDRGHFAYGLEGSSSALTGVGQDNWTQYQDKNLFLCDITKWFYFKDDFYDEKFLFDFIHCSEVIEHLKPEELHQFFMNVHNNLSDTGIFCCQINTTPDVRHVDGKEIVLHHSVLTNDQWRVKLQMYFNPCYHESRFDENHLGYLFGDTKFRDHGSSSFYACLTKIP